MMLSSAVSIAIGLVCCAVICSSVPALIHTHPHPANVTCLNHTTVEVESIRVENTVNATSTIIDANRTCSTGYTWTGIECRKSIVHDGRCASGYDRVDGLCERIEPPICPTGFRHADDSSGKCVLQVQFEVDCEAGLVWNGEICVHSLPACQKGYTLLNGLCMRQAEPQCRANTKLIDGKCVSTKTAPIQCAHGFVMIGSECRSSSQIICESGFLLVGEQCVRNETIGPVLSCAEGMHLEGDKCVSSLRCNASDGYVLKGTKCVRLTLSCQEGFTLDEALGRCVRSECVPEVPQCPDGYRFREGRCYAVNPVVQVRCNDTEVLVNGTCVTRPVCGTVLPKCSLPGYWFDGRQCVGNDTVSNAWCPNGLVLQNGWCLQANTTNCTVPSDCPDGFELIERRCVPIRRPPSVAVCPDGYHANGTICVPDNVRPICPPDMILSGTWCVSVAKPPKPVCPNGMLLTASGTCVDDVVTAVCPPGYTLINGMCYCPDAIRPCPADRPVLLSNGTCAAQPPLITPVLPPIAPVCPNGYAFVNATKSCEVISAPIVIECRRGWRYNKITRECELIRCPNGYAYNATTDLCDRLPNRCPPGFEYNTLYAICVQTPIRPPVRPPVPVCPSDHYFANGLCYANPQPDNEQIIVQVGNCSRGCDRDASIVHTTTVVDQPVNVVTNNENNVNVHLYENGQLISTRRNNETVVTYQPPTDSVVVDNGGGPNEHEEDALYEDVLDDDQETTGRDEKCCTVVSPRKCVRKNSEWDCTHRQSRRCGWFCTNSTISLVPRQTAYRHGMLVMRPPPPNAWWLRTAGSLNAYGNDCSGCLNGGYACSSYCYTYSGCGRQDDCRQVDLVSFCEANGGDGCAPEDGCLE